MSIDPGTEKEGLCVLEPGMSLDIGSGILVVAVIVEGVRTRANERGYE